jgi:hypothetical protein
VLKKVIRLDSLVVNAQHAERMDGGVGQNVFEREPGSAGCALFKLFHSSMSAALCGVSICRLYA